MNKIHDFTHIPLKWEKRLDNARMWQLKFDDEVILEVGTGGHWLLNLIFNRYTFVKSQKESWRVKKMGSVSTFVYEFRIKNVLGKKAYEIGFRSKGKEGMFNPSPADSFRWKKLEGGNGMAWYQDGLEVVRFEKTGRSFMNFNYTSSVTKNQLDERWLAVMLATGFLVLT